MYTWKKTRAGGLAGFLLLLMAIWPNPTQAACSGTVYFKAPDSWTNVYANVSQRQTRITTVVDGWHVIDLATVTQQDWATKFDILSAAGHPVYYVNGTVWNAFEQYSLPQETNQITCPGVGNTIYLAEEPLTPGKPYIGTSPPNAKYLYFLPPDDEDWSQGIPQMIIDGGTPQNMRVDAVEGRCGWYTAVFEEPPTNIVFALDSDNENKIGMAGVEELEPLPFDLKAQFDALGGDTLYFEADAGAAGWSVTYQGGTNSCGYALAAFIYDTDAALHPSFSGYSAGGEGCQYGAQGVSATEAQQKVNNCIGVTTGIVDPILGDDNKPVFSGSTNANACFQEKHFNQLFNQVDDVNEKICSDLPFSRSLDGKWEFNSDFFVNTNGDGDQVIGGYYPAEHTADGDVINGKPLPAARKKRPAEGPVFVGPYLRTVENLVENVPRMDLLCNGPGWDGGNDCETLFNDGDDLAALVPPSTCVWGWSCDDGSNRPTNWPTFLNGTETPATPTTQSPSSRWTSSDPGRNQHFCFETHAKFKYREGQRFSFRGDDDIWVFIGGKLAVDLGGTHLAAPGYVDLGAITDKNNNKLVVGSEYPIDIFFCDRRTTMSNVRIKTNIYFDQKSGLYAEQDPKDPNKNQMCLMSGSTNSCEAVLNPTGVDQVKCGEDIADMLEFYLTNRLGDTLWIDATKNTACSVSGADTKCYTGISLNTGYITVDKTKLTGLAGTYIVWARIKPGTSANPPPPARIMKFTTATSVSVISGLTDVFGNLAPPSGVVAGKRVPVYFASGSYDPGTGIFAVNTEPEVEGTSFTLNGSAGLLADASINAELLIYTSETGGSPVPLSTQFTIKASGLCTLWVAGTYRADDDYTYTINVSGAKTNPVKLTARLPMLKFVDENGDPVEPVGTGLRDPDGEVGAIMMGIESKKWLIAYDPADGSLCTSCNFSLTGKSEVPDTTIARAMEFFGLRQSDVGGVLSGGIVDGKAAISWSGSEPVKKPHYANAFIYGLSNKTMARWDTLRFKEPPVPYPLFSGMYDKDGNGIGDSLHIQYSRKFHPDSLPDTLFIWWPEASTDSIRIAKADVGQYLRADSIIAIADRNFTEKVMTSGQGRVRSWATYQDPDTKKIETTGFPKTIEDRMGPVVARASYTSPKSKCGSSQSNACVDRISLEFSEPVLLDSVANTYGDTATLDLYEFKLLNSAQVGWQVIPPTANTRSDSVASLSYLRYENGPSTPMALDSVRLRGNAADLRLLRDMEGNFPHALNGTKIEGEKPLQVKSVVITTLNPEDPEVKKRLDQPPVNLSTVPMNISVDSLPAMFPGTVGQLVMVDIPGKVFSLGLAPEPADISITIKTQYFTNLGSYVAQGDFKVSCADPVLFNGSCLDNPSYIYVAWNGVTDGPNARFVGSGAYISTLQFYWTVKNALGSTTTQDKKEQTDILGIRRGSGVQK